MHQAPAAVWNQIAETQPLRTTWAQQMFPMPPEAMEDALAQEEERLTKETGSSTLASAYLRVMPLLWERTAISKFLQENPSQSPALGQIPADSHEATVLASQDFPLTAPQMKRLHRMLQTEPK
jgi:hypothetical protein